MFKRLKRWWRERQVLAACGCVCYCPKCREIMNDIGACKEIEDGVYRYTCPCGFRPVFDFVLAPVPLYREHKGNGDPNP